MSATRAASRAQSSEALYETMPIADMIQRIAMTMSSSTKEKASRRMLNGVVRMFMGR